MKSNLQHAQAPSACEQLEARVLRVLGDLFQLPAYDIPRDASFEELGADSADFVELQIMLLEEFGVEIPEHAAPSVRTVDDLVALLNQRLQLSGA